MAMDMLTRAWLTLIALTAATAAIAGLDGRVAAAGLLALAWLKARVILGRYLHLHDAPGWLGAFMLPLAIWMLSIATLYALIVT